MERIIHTQDGKIIHESDPSQGPQALKDARKREEEVQRFLVGKTQEIDMAGQHLKSEGTLEQARRAEPTQQQKFGRVIQIPKREGPHSQTPEEEPKPRKAAA